MTVSASYQASRASSIDVLRDKSLPWAFQLLSITGFALLTAVGAQIRIYAWEVPVTFQTLAVYGSGLFLGRRNGFLAQILYLSLGLFFPVYAGGNMGMQYLFAAPTAGYLLAFPLAAYVVGVMSKHHRSLLGVTIGQLVGSLIIFLLGVTWLHYATGHESWARSLDLGWLRFLPVDLAKILAVGGLYSALKRALIRR